ncbi:hypothetical protein [Nocardioides sp.]|uniref:hypothetical protein n=1 Tax=Nocardioides sp. TaxID=35761 RepID=UPI002EDB1D61
MSKERAQRRAEREREAAALAAARAAELERRERRDARRRAITSRLPKPPKRPAGLLAQRRRRQNGALLAGLVALNVLVWIVFGEWDLRLAAFVVSVLAAPVFHTMLFRRT